MLCVGLLLSSDEWQRIQQAAAEQFPGKVLSRAEIVRRYTLAGIEALKNASDADRARVQHQHQATMCVAGPEGDKPRTSWD
jgi:hypothetical protein